MMLRFALRNILRHKARTVTTLAAVTFGVAALMLSRGFVDDTFVQLGEALIHSQSGHLQLARSGYFERGAQEPEKYLIAQPDQLRSTIAGSPQIADVAARLRFSGLLNNGEADYSVIGEGIEPEREASLGTYLRVPEGRPLRATDRYHVLLGHGVARALRLRPGDRALLLGTSAGGPISSLDLEVVGTFQTFSKEYDDRAVRVPLAAARELLDNEGANTLVVTLHRTEDTATAAATLRDAHAGAGLAVQTWQQLNDFYPKTVNLYERLFGGLELIVLLMVLLSVVNAVNMTVFERTAEFGTARALGHRGRQVVALILTENMLIGLIGGLLGLAVGFGLGHLISAVGIPMPPPPNAELPYVGYIRITALGAAEAFLIGFVACIAASLLPALRIARLPIVDALRHSI